MKVSEAEKIFLSQEKRIAALEALVGRLAAAFGVGSSSASSTGPVDLDGKYGDPTVHRDPSRWKGPIQQGKHFSECPAEFLDVLAEAKDFHAGKLDEKGEAKNARYARLDAARARGWAKRIRGGWKPPPPPPEPVNPYEAQATSPYDDDSEIPF